MEVQVNVAKDNGEPIQGSFEGHRWYGFTDGMQTWKPFRVPFAAASNPQYVDHPIRFDISAHAEAIGMTGWNWKEKRSLWVGFDYDSLIGHKQGLSKDELEEIHSRVRSIPYITIYSSSSGNGLHIYCLCNISPVTNHTEHAALARAILSKTSALSGIDLQAKVDTLGGILWVWRRDAIEGKSFVLLKEATETLTDNDVPNWQAYLDGVSRTKLVPKKITTSEDELSVSRRHLKLDDRHLQLIQWFEKSSALWWWHDDRQMLVCHTYDLKKAHTELKFTGIFDTVSTGKDIGKDQNCFCFPLSNGAWIIRRHGKGTIETSTWFTDTSGWTTCYYNTLPSFITASQYCKGIQDEKGYHFRSITDAISALSAMGIQVPELNISARPCKLRELDDKRVVLSFDKLPSELLDGYIDKKGQWTRIFFRPKVNEEIDVPDHLVRHLITGATESGWVIYASTGWVEENRNNVEKFLLSQGSTTKEIPKIIGTCVGHNWLLVNKPFKPEYPGNREWNRDAAQFRFDAQKGHHPTWDMILHHCGQSLDSILTTQSTWGIENGIYSGLLYLQCWLASCLQNPGEPTPYLFFYSSQQNTGKSIFHEALSLLFTKGVVRADNSLISAPGFNGELAGAIFCVVEETNLSRKSNASDRIKDWVTGKTIAIHCKGQTPYDLPNNTHWIQCANDPSYCPVLAGDTRISVLRVDPLKEEIPKHILIERCEKEAPAFLYTLMHFDIPEPIGRLRLPVIETDEKAIVQEYHEDSLSEFIRSEIYHIPGCKVLLGEFYEKFMQWIDVTERNQWTLRGVAKRARLLKGKHGADNATYFANVSFSKDSKPNVPYNVKLGRLVQ